MKTIFSWRPESRIFPRPPLKKFREFAQVAAAVTGSGIRRCFSVSFVSAEEMIRANWELVGHNGLTDVICFDYREASMPETDPSPEEAAVSEVDLIVCPAAALLQSEKRHEPYCHELALYVVHGLLHSAGFDDLVPVHKRRMRRHEKSVMAALEKRFDLFGIFPEPVHGKDV